MRAFVKSVTEYTCQAIIDGREKEIRVYGCKNLRPYELAADIREQTSAQTVQVLSTVFKDVKFKLNYYDLPIFGEMIKED